MNFKELLESYVDVSFYIIENEEILNGKLQFLWSVWSLSCVFTGIWIYVDDSLYIKFKLCVHWYKRFKCSIVDIMGISWSNNGWNSSLVSGKSTLEKKTLIWKITVNSTWPEYIGYSMFLTFLSLSGNM